MRAGPRIFNDQVLATAILDRLLYHAMVLNIKGERNVSLASSETMPGQGSSFRRKRLTIDIVTTQKIEKKNGSCSSRIGDRLDFAIQKYLIPKL